jgi:hypothetical protein
MKPTMYSCQIVRPSSAKAIGIESSATARTTSPRMRIGLRRIRSTQTPAGRLRRMNGRNSIAPRRPNSNGVTFSVVAAISGSASSVIWVPKTLIVSAVHSFTKSRWRRRLRLVSVTEASTGGLPEVKDVSVASNAC